VCSRHNMELEGIPKARKHGWPTSIQWEELPDRVQKMEKELNDLVNNPRIRNLSEFWNRITGQIAEKGSLSTVFSSKNQFASFDRALTGYYGSLGYGIIYSKLLQLFPPNNNTNANISPLDMNMFLIWVLVPETAVRLIIEDQQLSGPDCMAIAVNILDESSQYGMAMFPE
ncbi:hypothetical protein K435DRAFT_576061, partial [Dendrothele bispora CBS 962.96]